MLGTITHLLGAVADSLVRGLALLAQGGHASL